MMIVGFVNFLISFDLKNLTFDQICHEHLVYYTFNVFEDIVKKQSKSYRLSIK